MVDYNFSARTVTEFSEMGRRVPPAFRYILFHVRGDTKNGAKRTGCFLYILPNTIWLCIYQKLREGRLELRQQRSNRLT